MPDPGRDPLELARRHFADRGVAAHVVGGRVRDALLGRVTWDTDLVVPGGALEHARALAGAGGAAFVPLDEERGIARVVWPAGDGPAAVLDVADMVGPDMASDLAARDFTVNAMAVPLEAPWPPQRAAVADPCGGMSDLDEMVLRMTSPAALDDDPLRLLRAVRLSAELGFEIDPGTREAITARAPSVLRPAAERSRDELLRVVKAVGTPGSVRSLSDLGLLRCLVPELEACRAATASRPGEAGDPQLAADGGERLDPARGPSRRLGRGSTRDVFEHSLAVAGAMEAVVRDVAVGSPGRGEHDLKLPMSFESVLAEYREPLRAHLQGGHMGGYSRAVYLELAALLHDVGKPDSRAADESGAPRVPHGELGAAKVAAMADRLRFGSSEANYLAAVVRHHPRPLAMARADGATRSAIYHFFTDAGPAGVDVAMLALADNAVKPEHSRELLEAIATVVGQLLAAWFVEPHVAVDPVPLLSGTAVMRELQLEPGPEVGRILTAVREAQAVGAVADRQSAVELALHVHRGGEACGRALPVHD